MVTLCCFVYFLFTSILPVSTHRYVIVFCLPCSSYNVRELVSFVSVTCLFVCICVALLFVCVCLWCAGQLLLCLKNGHLVIWTLVLHEQGISSFIWHDLWPWCWTHHSMLGLVDCCLIYLISLCLFCIMGNAFVCVWYVAIKKTVVLFSMFWRARIVFIRVICFV